MIGIMFENPYTYSLGARCGCELIGTMIAVFLGDASVANMLLAKTKGNDYGWGFLSFGFGLPFGFVTMMFSHISAYLNPAACLFQWVVGNMNGKEFLALSFSELAGAFLGAVLLWLIYLPHFNIVPEPPSVTDADPFLEDPLMGAGANRVFTPGELAAGGYNNDPLEQYMRLHPGQALHSTVKDIGELLSTVQADLQARQAELARSLQRPSLKDRETVEQQLAHLRERSRTLSEHEMKARMAQATLEKVTASRTNARDDSLSMTKHSTIDVEDGGRVAPPRKTPAEVRYEALLIADQNIKLGIFSTRPAIYAPHWNFLCEFMATVTLLVMANMIAARGNQLYEPSRGLWSPLFGFILGFFIFLIVLNLGGPTGVALNPARDLGPRIAHWILPIPGKGPSEFITYGWIPILAPFCGGAAAGGLFIALQKMTAFSNVPAGSVTCS